MTGSYDPGAETCCIGSLGDAAADLNASQRRGDNLYTDSVIALDPDTGKLKWHYQEIPQDVWDYDAAYEMQLVDLPVNGDSRKLLVHVTKSGFTWVLDRVTGEFLTAWPYVKNYNWITGIAAKWPLRAAPNPSPTRSSCSAPAPSEARAGTSPPTRRVPTGCTSRSSKSAAISSFAKKIRRKVTGSPAATGS